MGICRTDGVPGCEQGVQGGRSQTGRPRPRHGLLPGPEAQGHAAEDHRLRHRQLDHRQEGRHGTLGRDQVHRIVSQQGFSRLFIVFSSDFDLLALPQVKRENTFTIFGNLEQNRPLARVAQLRPVPQGPSQRAPQLDGQLVERGVRGAGGSQMAGALPLLQGSRF